MNSENGQRKPSQMLLREPGAKLAAIRFRRLYLETVSSQRFDTATAWRLALLQSKAVWLSKEVVAICIAVLMMLVCTMPLGSEALPHLLRITYFLLVAISTLAGLILLFLIIAFARIKRFFGDKTTTALAVLSSVVCYASSFEVWRALLALPLAFTLPEITVRAGLVMATAVLIILAVSPYTLSRLMRQSNPNANLQNLLEESKRGRLVAISAQDHYVGVTTTLGTELLRMKLSDAIDGVNPGIGLQVHRSHWVAISAIKSVDERARTVEVIDGQVLPVSEQKMPELILELVIKDVYRQQEKLFARSGSNIGLLEKLLAANRETKRVIDQIYLEAFRGKQLSERKKFQIAQQIHKLGTTTAVFLAIQTVHFVGLSSMGPFGLYALDWYQPVLFWLIGYALMAVVVVPLHPLIWYMDFKFGSKAYPAVVAALLCETTLAVMILPPLAHFMFGPGFVPVPIFFISTLVMLAVIIPSIYAGVREHQSFQAWKTALNIPPIMLQLPYEARGEIVSISAKSRAVLVNTTAGGTVLKKQFGDALALLGEREGLQVHRSHWVAKEFVKGRRVENGSNFVLLTTGDTVPLSVANIAMLDEFLTEAA